MKIDGETYWDGNAGKAEAYVCDVVSRVGGVKSYACVESLVGFLVLPDAVVSALCVLGGSPHLSMLPRVDNTSNIGNRDTSLGNIGS